LKTGEKSAETIGHMFSSLGQSKSPADISSKFN